MNDQYLNLNDQALFGCDKGHTFADKVKTVMDGGGCPVCEGRKVAREVNEGYYVAVGGNK